MNLCFVVNDLSFLRSHRREICIAAEETYRQVHIVCPPSVHAAHFENLGIHLHEVEFHRGKEGPISEAILFFKLLWKLRRIKPDLVHLITIKPYLYGGIIARLIGIRAVVSAVAGLGMVFSSKSIRYKLLRIIIMPLFRFSLSHPNQVIICQNVDDKKALCKINEDLGKKIHLIAGSGVCLTDFSYTKEPKGIAVVSFASRLLIDKGVRVFVEAARIIREREIAARFWLIGDVDKGNNNSVSLQEIKTWEEDRLIEFLGPRDDVALCLSKSNIVTLPSYYGEGLPKVLMEAAAVGRAVVTTDHPGCRDAVTSDTGLLIPTRDPVALADAVEILVKNPTLRQQMGVAGRRYAESKFCVENVVKAHLEIYKSLVSD